MIDHREELVYLGINGVAERLGCSPSAVRLWEGQGRIPPAGRVAGTGRRVWPVKVIDAFTTKQTTRQQARPQAAIRN